MPKLFNEAELEETRSLAPDVPTIGEGFDVSKRYSQRFGEQAQYENLLNQQNLQRQYDTAEQQRRSAFAGASRQLGGGEGAGLGAYTAGRMQGQELQQVYGLTSKEISTTLAPEIQKDFRVQGLKEEMLRKEIPRYTQIFNRDLMNFQNAVNKLKQKTAYKLQDEIEQAQQGIERDYNASVRYLKSKIMRRETARKVVSNVLGGTLAAAGTVIGAFGSPAGAAALGSAGMALGQGLGRAFTYGGQRYKSDLQRSIRL